MESCTPEGWIIVDVRDINDSGDNSIEELKTKITLVSNLLASGQKVVVRCLAGMSRSNSIACAAMMLINITLTWNDCWNQIRGTVPRAVVNNDLQDAVKKALSELIPDNRRRIYYE